MEDSRAEARKRSRAGMRIGLGVVLLLLQLTREDLGFTSQAGDEAIGYNAFALAMYTVAIWLIVSGIKRARRARQSPPTKT